MARPFDATVPSGPLIDRGTLDLTPAWRAFLTALWARTGGAQGTASGGWEQPLAAETEARVQGDAALGQALGTETMLREMRDNGLASQIVTEADARAAADALLVPLAQLCSLWAACDLSFLPTADPGLGKPWLDGNHIAIGLAPGTTVGIGLEDASGRWGLEDGSGVWLYG